jgi:ABC-2 type transport system permease protein
VLAVAALIPAIDLKWQYGVVPGLLLALAGIVLFNLLLASFAHLLASRIRTMAGFHLVMNLVLFPLLFISGAFFPLDEVPIWLEVLGRANPLSYAVDLIHLAIYAESSEGYVGIQVDIPLLLALTLAFIYWGVRRHPGSQW